MLRMILSLTLAAAAARAQPGDTQPLRRVVALLDYVRGDYARAVGEHGEVLSQAEHSEQIGFVEDAVRELRADVNGRGEDLAKRLDALRQRVAERAPPAEVAQGAQAVRDEIVQRFNVVLLPLRAPDVRRGAQVYAQACAACHGIDGHPNPALGLETRSPDFHSEGGPLTPQRIFSAATYGVLAALSDDDLRRRLAAAGLAAGEQEEALAALRGGPFAEDVRRSSQGLAQARAAVQNAVLLARHGDTAGARRALISAYLDHFEPHEAGLRVREGPIVQEVEAAFLALRASIDSRDAQLEARAARLDGLLEKADARSAGGGLVAFVGALAIALREGVEAALLVAAMLALLRKAGRERDADAVHVGWVSASLAGAATWWASGMLLVHLSGASRELAEGVFQLITAALLLYASHWLLAALSAKRLVSFVSTRTMAAGSAAVILGLSFMVVYREMFEAVLFFRGLLLEVPGTGAAVAAGAAAGLLALVGLVAAFQRVGRRLRPRPLLLSCGILLCALAVLMVGHGVRSLQILGAVPLTIWGAFQVPALGLYATREGLCAQALVLLALVGSALWTALRRDRHDGDAPDRHPSPATSTAR